MTLLIQFIIIHPIGMSTTKLPTECFHRYIVSCGLEQALSPTNPLHLFPETLMTLPWLWVWAFRMPKRRWSPHTPCSSSACSQPHTVSSCYPSSWLDASHDNHKILWRIAKLQVEGIYQYLQEIILIPLVELSAFKTSCSSRLPPV